MGERRQPEGRAGKGEGVGDLDVGREFLTPFDAQAPRHRADVPGRTPRLGE